MFADSRGVRGRVFAGGLRGRCSRGVFAREGVFARCIRGGVFAEVFAVLSGAVLPNVCWVHFVGGPLRGVGGIHLWTSGLRGWGDSVGPLVDWVGSLLD